MLTNCLRKCHELQRVSIPLFLSDTDDIISKEFTTCYCDGTEMKASRKPRTKNRRTIQRDVDPVIYCLEGVWRQIDDQQDQRSRDASVEPLLQYLKSNEYWDFRHRNVATVPELKYFLDNEWSRCTEGSILYLPTHGSPGCISLGTGHDVYMIARLNISSDQRPDEMPDLISLLSSWDQDNCHLHFCGCAIFEDNEDWIDEFIDKTKFAVVSGYTQKDLGWTDAELPAVLADIMLFSQLSEVDYSDKSKFEPILREIQEVMDCRFKDCGFFYKIR